VFELYREDYPEVFDCHRAATCCVRNLNNAILPAKPFLIASSIQFLIKFLLWFHVAE